ncbi:unnamed protein product, partial [Allacma fusca]
VLITSPIQPSHFVKRTTFVEHTYIRSTTSID